MKTRRIVGPFALPLLGLLAGACGSDETPAGNNVTCGTGTRLEGTVCLSDGAGPGGTLPDGGPASATDATTAGAAAPQFTGVTSVAPATTTSLQITWDAAKDTTTPAEKLVYNVYVATSAGAQNFSAPTFTTPPGATSVVLSTFTNNTTYFVVVRAVNEAKVEDKNTAEKSGKTEADSVVPAFGGATLAEPAADGSLKISWTPATDDRTAAAGMTYLVYLATSAGGEDLSGPSYVSDVGASSIVIKNLPVPEGTYYAIVRARDAAGNLDTNKVEVSAKNGKDTKAPVFAGCTSATVKDASTITVSWKAATDDTTPAGAILYDVFASKTAGVQDFTTPTATFSSGTLGDVGGLLPSSQYFLVCRARDLSGNADTNKLERTATTLSDGTPPTFLGITTVSNVTSTTVDLNWAAATDDQTIAGDIVYDVYQAEAAGGETFGPTPTLSSLPGATSVTIPDLTPAKQYYWVVRARDKAGNRDQNTVEKTGTTKVSFQLNVFPILSQHCATAGCHVAGNPPFGLVLTPRSIAYGNLLLSSGEVPASKRVLAGDSANSYLFKKLNGPPPAPPAPPVGELMPPAVANDVLTANERNTIKSWIDQGALSN